MNKTKLVVTRVFDSRRTPQDAFVRAILNSGNADKTEKRLQEGGCEGPVFNSYANIKRRNYSIYVACGVLGFQNGI